MGNRNEEQKMMKDLYRSAAKGVVWQIWTRTNYKREDTLFPYVTFYLLPTIEYSRIDSFGEEDNEIDINFKWLFWQFTISRYWGDVYKK